MQTQEGDGAPCVSFPMSTKRKGLGGRVGRQVLESLFQNVLAG